MRTGSLHPKVSIIMAIFNGQLHLEQAIRSLLDQSMVNIEIVVVNDGSVDGSQALLDRMAADDGRLVVRVTQNSGRPAIARNVGLGLARADYIGFLDHDDFSHPERLRTMVDALDAHPKWVAAFHDIALVDADGQPIGDTYLGSCRFKEIAAEHLCPLGGDWYVCGPDFSRFASLYTPAMHTQSVLIARSRVGREQIRFDPQFLICEDTDLWIRLALAGQIGFLDRTLGSYRRLAMSLTTNKLAFLQSTVQAHVHNYERVKELFDAATLSKYRERIGGHYATLGWYYYQALLLEQARTQFELAVNWWPSREHRKLLARARLPQWLIQSARLIRTR